MNNFEDDADKLKRAADALANMENDSGFKHLAGAAKLLADADFSADSAVRSSLRKRLLERAEQKRGRAWTRLVPALAGAAALAAIGIFAASSGTATTLRDFIHRFFVGSHTEIVEVRPEVAVPTQQPAPAIVRAWQLKTPIGNFGGEAQKGMPWEIRRFNSLASAKKELPALRSPGWLPESYRLRKVMITPENGALSIFSGEQDDIFLYQVRTGNKAVSRTATSAVAIVDHAGKHAAWIPDGYGLVWEQDGVSYTLGGTTLNEETAFKIADSL
jgi:hypothetical protein